MSYPFRISQDHAMLVFENNEEKPSYRWNYKFKHYAILHRVLNMMRDRGFQIGRDPGVHKCITKDHWYGRKGDLEFKAERYPAGFNLKFYQNLFFENPHGGYYDFDRYSKMPYMIKLMFRNEIRHIKSFLESLGCVDDSVPVFTYASDKVKYNFVESWHYPQKTMEEFELSDLDGQTCEMSYNNIDRDKKTIYNGQIKYFRDQNGRLGRGRVYHDLNNMWWVILNTYNCTRVADFELFDPTPDDYYIRRKKRDVKPKEYLLKKEQLSAANTKELISELKRRGIKVVS